MTTTHASGRGALFGPYQMGSLLLPNRIVMAPLTRSRADSEGVPSPLAPEYYAQRSSAGLIVAEATTVSRQGTGYLGGPGLYTDAHVAGWALALAKLDGGAWARLRGPAESVLSPPLRSTHDGKAPLGPCELRLPGGRTPHDFMRTAGDGERVEVERFETIRPDATVELPPAAEEPESDSSPTRAIDVLVELDDRLPVGRTAAKLERYDHFLAGWSAHTSRYGRRLDAVPVVAFVCRDRAWARRCAAHADPLLSACRAYAGEYPADWEYPGRDLILFASERDIHEGLARAYGVPRLPPAVRVSAAGGDPRAGEARAEPREIPSLARRSGGSSRRRAARFGGA